ncbi:MAG: hypothetical protein K2X27_17570 [Candidatus Obscuribacterales bacterium]|nr:hypothetical protein [Candidatus Obscuribacterales bacterium]
MSNKLSKRFTAAASSLHLGWPPKNLLGQKKMFLKKVIFDLHGPILDFNTPFLGHLSGLYGVPLDETMLDHYNMGYNARMPITPHQFNRGLENFGRLARGGFSDLPAKAGIVEALKQIQEAGIKLEIWTYAPGATDYSHDTLVANGTGIAQLSTIECIQRLGIVKDVRKQVRFIKPEAKAPTMAHEHCPLIVEDHPVTAMAAGTYGNAALLVPEHYNQGISAPGVLRLDNRTDLAPAVISFFKELEEAGSLIGGGR